MFASLRTCSMLIQYLAISTRPSACRSFNYGPVEMGEISRLEEDQLTGKDPPPPAPLLWSPQVFFPSIFLVKKKRWFWRVLQGVYEIISQQIFNLSGDGFPYSCCILGLWLAFYKLFYLLSRDFVCVGPSCFGYCNHTLCRLHLAFDALCLVIWREIVGREWKRGFVGNLSLFFISLTFSNSQRSAVWKEEAVCKYSDLFTSL